MLKNIRLVRNLIAIKLFLGGIKLSRQSVDKEINRAFGAGTAGCLRENMVKKNEFLPLFRKIYNLTFDEIMGKQELAVKAEPVSVEALRK